MKFILQIDQDTFMRKVMRIYNLEEKNKDNYPKNFLENGLLKMVFKEMKAKKFLK